MILVNPPDSVRELSRNAPFARLADGRPDVPLELLDRLRSVTIEQTWKTLVAHGYERQFDGGWQRTNGDRVLVGRAVTAAFVPHRADLNELVEEAARSAGLLRGEAGQKQNSWVIDRLEMADVLVVDMFGKVHKGPFVGDNLATTIATRTRAGAVINGTVRDAQGIAAIPGLQIFCRGFHPSAIREAILAGINFPMRIGEATVLPGDVVLGTQTGVVFIPPHLLTEVVERAEQMGSRDRFGKLRLRERRYTAAEIDREWSPAIEDDFRSWLAAERNNSGDASKSS